MSIFARNNPELPVINSDVLMFEVPLNDYVAQQKKLAGAQVAQKILHALTLGIYTPPNQAEAMGWKSGAEAVNFFKSGAEQKASKLIGNPLVGGLIEETGGVKLFSRTHGAQWHVDPQTQRIIAEDNSTEITAYAEYSHEHPARIDWAFDITNGAPASDKLRSLIWIQTNPSADSILDKTKPKYEISGIEAYNIATGQAYGPQDYPNQLLARKDLYCLAEDLFSYVESGLTKPYPPLTTVSGY